MTPQERQLVDELFDRLATLENNRRDPEAERAIFEGFQRAPNAAYALVQSVLVQDEALKRADDRIKELEAFAGAAGATRAEGGGFLDSMRNMIRGGDEPRGSVPPVRPGGLGSSGAWSAGPRPDSGPAPSWNQPAGGPPAGQPASPGFGGGSFLGTAAAVAAGAIGGGLLLNGIRSMMGGGTGSAHAAYEGAGGGRSPWDSGASGGDLAREAGLNDIGGGGGRSTSASEDKRAGLFDSDKEGEGGDRDFDLDDDSDIAGDFDGGGGDSDVG